MSRFVCENRRRSSSINPTPLQQIDIRADIELSNYRKLMIARTILQFQMNIICYTEIKNQITGFWRPMIRSKISQVPRQSGSRHLIITTNKTPYVAYEILPSTIKSLLNLHGLGRAVRKIVSHKWQTSKKFHCVPSLPMM
jgi:hypothetical protein